MLGSDRDGIALIVTIRVVRKYKFFLYNVYLYFFIITSLGFTSFYGRTWHEKYGTMKEWDPYS